MTRSEALREAIAFAIDQQEDRINWASGVRKVTIAVSYDTTRDLPSRVIINEETETVTEVYRNGRVAVRA